jgi:hypothetical protein
MRIRIAAIAVALAAAFSLLASGAEAQTAVQGTRTAQASQLTADDLAAQPPARRPLKRLRIYPRNQADPDDVYPRYFPGQNAVRECNATYVQEHRPSGTVIVPRMNCYWRRG